jgi:hypothetical protein
MMSILGSIFGKKKDDLGLGELGNLENNPEYNQPLGSPDAGYGAPADYGAQGQGGFSPEAMGFERVQPTNPSYANYPSPQQNIGEISMGKDLELINAKLDAIKAEIDAMSQRLKRLERIAEGENSTPANKWNY